jgi:hypothetical protein
MDKIGLNIQWVDMCMYLRGFPVQLYLLTAVFPLEICQGSHFWSPPFAPTRCQCGFFSVLMSLESVIPLTPGGGGNAAWLVTCQALTVVDWWAMVILWSVLEWANGREDVTKRTWDNNGLIDSKNNDHKLFFFLCFLCVIFSLVRWPVAR